MNNKKIFKQSIRISRLIDNGKDLNMIYQKWSCLRKRLYNEYYRSKKYCEEKYCIKKRVEEIKNLEALSITILYYSDRWHPARVRTFDEAFKKILTESLGNK